MASIQRSIFVNGRKYRVTEKGDWIKAHLQGKFGWDAIYADSYVALVRRIRWAESAV